jgi:Glycosyl transferase family 2
MASKIALIIEWDNARLSEVDRAREMLRRVGAQAVAAARTTNAHFDLLLIYDPETIEPAVPRTVLAECVDENTWPGRISVHEASGRHYYEQKNFGVRQTDADTIIFIDSDVVPDDGWLAILLEAMRDPQVSVVSGETYLATDTYYDRLLAAFWLFETKKPARSMYEVKNFYANNVAFRGDIVRAFPFPSAETYRGQCTTLAKTLRASGVRLHRAGSAMVSHPPPSGLWHFINRAFCHGHDIVLSNKAKRLGWLAASPLGAVFRFLREVTLAPGRILRRRQASVQSIPGALLAFALAVAYASVKLAGEVATFVSPRFVRSRFSI